MKKLDGDNKNLIYLCLVSDIDNGRSKIFSISDGNGLTREIAVFNIEGKFYAISNICAHKGGPLNQGLLEKNIVTCPWHGWKYDVRTGKSPHKGGDSVDSFEVQSIDNKLFLNSNPSACGRNLYKPYP